jgi:hypothetical protein
MLPYEIENNVIMKMAVFWVVAPCSLVEVYQRFKGPCCRHHQSSGGGRQHGPPKLC